MHAVSPEIVEGQIHAVFEDLTVDAVKIGMLHNWEAARIVARSIDHFCPSKIILDPVMISTSGSKLIEDETIEVIVKELFHRVTLITPNIDEAAFLSGMQIRNEEEMEIAAQKLLVSGCRAVLMKGGHLEGKEMADILFTHDEAPSDWLCRPFRLKIHTVQVAHLVRHRRLHMALGKELPDAVRAAKRLHNGSPFMPGPMLRLDMDTDLQSFFDPVPLIKIEV
ncbi:MAG: bifunctional hydroxymethylpyrimidine kinase/phosphomethylpyrimidine kinase [Parabacteroides merdae]